MILLDSILVWAALFFVVVFLILGISKLIKFYIWLMIWLLICILVNLKLNDLSSSWVASNGFEKFLLGNEQIISSFSLFAIPLMGFLFLLNRSFIIQENDSEWWLWGSIWNIAMWLLLLPIALGMYAIVESLGISKSTVLENFIAGIAASKILNLLSEYSAYIFFLLLALLAYKFVFKFIFIALIYFIGRISKLREEEREIRRLKKEQEEQEELTE